MINIRSFKPIDTFSVIKLASITLPEQYNPSLFTFFYETYPKGFIIAELNHKIIGFLVGVKIHQKKAKILMLSVNPDFHRQKIGEKLLFQFIKTIINENIKRVELEVRTDNIKAIKFYEKYNFKKVKKIKNFYQNEESAYTMRLII
ncbi:MAG: ribosomal protein S18-alanine N-acetyltransferase [Thermoplasmatales archaeon]|nr:MAG: ribosomal protein S18-alanine N-acetyltransferase [Thermoplasmatales archaeon]